MNRVIHVAVAFAATLAIVGGAAFAQGQRSLMERKAWYVEENGKFSEMTFWRIILGNYNLKIKRTFPGESQITVDASINYQFLSSGYIEGDGMCSRGRVQSATDMRIGGEGNNGIIKLDEIDYIYDYGAKVAMKDGRKGEFLIAAEGTTFAPKRFFLTEYRMVKGSFGEMELKEVKEGRPEMGLPIVAIAFSKEGAAKAAKEPVTP